MSFSNFKKHTPGPSSSKQDKSKNIQCALIKAITNSNNSFDSIQSQDNYRYKKYTNKLPKYQEKGLVFVWPQRRKFYYSRELINITWFMAHALYILHVLQLLPSGRAIPMKQPPWKYKPPAKKPENRDYIIEPDWDS